VVAFGEVGNLIKFLLFIYHLEDCLGTVNYNPIIEVIQDCDKTYDDLDRLNFWYSIVELI
jgi:hypothetical protein